MMKCSPKSWAAGTSLLCLAFVAATIAAPAARQPNNGFKSVGPETAVHGLTVQELINDQRDLHDWLVSEVPADTGKNPVSVSLNERDRLDLSTPYIPGSRTPMRVGVVKNIDAELGFANGRPLGAQNARAKGATNSTRRNTADGGFVWATTITSPEALALRIHFENFAIPWAAEVYVYGPDGSAYGPYRGAGPDDSGEFWSHSIASSSATVVLRYQGAPNPTDLRNLSFDITQVAHVAIDFPTQNNQAQDAGSAASFCTYNASCIENNACTSDPAVNDSEGAVAKMRWIAGCCIYICSGGLIADTDTGSETAYFMTANHCISRAKDAKNLETFFQYTASCGTSNCPSSFGQPFSPPSTLGSVVRATGNSGDFTLLELNQLPPAGTTYLGWNSAPVAFSSGTPLHRISHPSGAPQAYSEHSVNTTAGECLQTDRGSWIYSDDVTGATEGGSSGSPVVNAAGEFVGQLTGCCPTGGGNCSDVCGSGTFTIDGAFASYFSSVSALLDNGGGGCTGDPECDDGLFCTGTETCSGGSCQSSGNPCGGGEVCNESTNSCDPSACNNNGTCDPGENCNNCSNDCDSKTNGPPSGRYCCGNGVLEGPEGDGRCDGNP